MDEYLNRLSDEALHVVDGRKSLFDHRLVLPVEIPPGQRAPRVAHDHAVGVQHGDDLE